MSSFTRFRSLMALLVVGLSLSIVAVDHADARRGGSFGSRGTRTYQAPPVTNTAPRQTAPVERTMTPRPSGETSSVRPPVAQQRPGFFNRFGGGILGGLLAGGLIGMLLGHGLGGAAGFLGLLLQLGLLALGAMLLMRLFRSSQRSASAYSGGLASRDRFAVPDARPIGADAGSAGGGFGRAPAAPAAPSDDIGVGLNDLDTFERLLTEVQDAYGREDFGALRERTTPEVLSYLAEELGENATRGVRNEVSDVKLLQGDVAEAWREGDTDYATVAMRYESRDVTRERATGRVVDGDPNRPTEATELWTFTRRGRGPWKLSAIQEA